MLLKYALSKVASQIQINDSSSRMLGGTIMFMHVVSDCCGNVVSG